MGIPLPQHPARGPGEEGNGGIQEAGKKLEEKKRTPDEEFGDDGEGGDEESRSYGGRRTR